MPDTAIDRSTTIQTNSRSLEERADAVRATAQACLELVGSLSDAGGYRDIRFALEAKLEGIVGNAMHMAGEAALVRGADEHQQQRRQDFARLRETVLTAIHNGYGHIALGDIPAIVRAAGDEPEDWPVVAEALEGAGLCPHCGKLPEEGEDGLLYCASCDLMLDHHTADCAECASPDSDGRR